MRNLNVNTTYAISLSPMLYSSADYQRENEMKKGTLNFELKNRIANIFEKNNLYEYKR